MLHCAAPFKRIGIDRQIGIGEQIASSQHVVITGCYPEKHFARVISSGGYLPRTLNQAIANNDMPLVHLLFSLFATAVFSTQLLADSAAQLGERPLPEPSEPIILAIDGSISHTNTGDSAQFDARMLTSLETHTLATETSVTDGVSYFEGFLLRDLLEWVGADGEQVIATALNNYIVAIPLDDFYQYDVLVATHMDGEALTPRDKGPLWIVYPRSDHTELQDIRYDYRWVWQLNGLTVE